MIVVCNSSSSGAEGDVGAETDENAAPAGFGARSLALSFLLGTHPPRLPGSRLVRAGELFGISSGAMRTALSRMASAGEIVSTEEGYTLSGRLVERQRRQDAGRNRPVGRWDGAWYTVTPVSPSRSLSERRQFRGTMEQARFGELRPDYWLRPTNLGRPEVGSGVMVTSGELFVDDLDGLLNDLWALPTLAERAEDFRSQLQGLAASADSEALADWLVPAFTLSADVVRFLMREPALPPALLSMPWAPDELRSDYNRFESLFQQKMAQFFAAKSR